MLLAMPGRWLTAIFCIVASSASAGAAEVEFVRDVVPVLAKTGCNTGACHGSFQGRGGFRLSLLGFDPAADYEALVKEARQRRLSPTAPEASLLLRKPLGDVAHGGGIRFDRESTAFRILRDWIAQGAPGPTSHDATLVAIETGASDAILQPGGEHAIRVTARWSDGAVRDVTSWTHFESRDESIARVSPAGVVTAQKPGRTSITIRYQAQMAALTVTVPFGTVAAREYPAANFIDRLIAAEWQKIGLEPAPLADDYEFCRRVHLDLIGALPTPDEIRQFVADETPDKRARLIDALLERPEYVDHWAHKWGDLLRVHRRYIGERGLWTFHGWIRRAVRENRPIDALVRELLTAQGNLYTEGPVAFYFTDTEPEQMAESAAQVFLGIRMQCARCHHHPYEIWSQDDYFGLANTFARVEIKDTGDQGIFGGAKLLRASTKVSRERRPKMSVEPQMFGKPIDADQPDIRVALAEWITAPENEYFARNWANRYWSYLMGRGLVDPVDDLRGTNPPSHPALLDALAEELVRSKFDSKALVRLICNSRAYQLAGDATPERDADGMFYTHRVLRRLPAAVLLDAVNQATGTHESFAGLPAGTRAQSLPDPSIASSFLETFGRSPRSSPCECAASDKPDLAQSLHMINSESLNSKIADKTGRIARLLEANTSDDEIVEELYLATLSRLPTEKERASIRAFAAEAPSRGEAFEDLLWTLLNSSSFVFQH